MPEAITLEEFDTNLVIRFSRPELRNPLSTDVLDRIHQIVDEIAENDAFRKLIFTGTDDVFASGADLNQIAQLTSESAREFGLKGQLLMAKIASLTQRTIAAVNGFCFGGALDLALACDKRVASSHAVFSHPGAGLGIITGWGGTQRLPRLIGESAAMEMLLTAARFDAEWALEVGLVDEISDTPLARALTLTD
jgi:enoyl-CoA hydratase